MRRGRSSKQAGPSPGIFENGTWSCDCDPRLSAVRLQVKKKTPNQGRWFWKCQRPRGAQCDFFQWDDAPTGQDNSSAPSSIITTIGQGSPPLPPLPVTPTRRQPDQFSPTSTAARARIPSNSIIQFLDRRPEASAGLFVDGDNDYNRTLFDGEELGLDLELPPANSTPPSSKRKRFKMEDDDDNCPPDSGSRTIQEDLFGDLNSDDEQHMADIADQSQTTTQKLSKLEREEAAIAAISGTPSTPTRQWPSILGGLPTPTTGNVPPADDRDPPPKRLKTAENTSSTAPPSSVRSPMVVPNSGRPGAFQQQLSQRDGDDYDVTTQVLRLLAGQMIPVSVRGAIRETLNTYALRARGVERGREMARTALEARNAKIADLQAQNAILQERIKRLTAGLEALYQEGNTAA